MQKKEVDNLFCRDRKAQNKETIRFFIAGEIMSGVAPIIDDIVKGISKMETGGGIQWENKLQRAGRKTQS